MILYRLLCRPWHVCSLKFNFPKDKCERKLPEFGVGRRKRIDTEPRERGIEWLTTSEENGSHWNDCFACGVDEASAHTQGACAPLPSLPQSSTATSRERPNDDGWWAKNIVACGSGRTTTTNKPNQLRFQWNALTPPLFLFSFISHSRSASALMIENSISSPPSPRVASVRCAPFLCVCSFASHRSTSPPSDPIRLCSGFRIGAYVACAPLFHTPKKRLAAHSTARNENVFPNTKLLFSKLLVLTKHSTETGYCVASFRLLCCIFWRSFGFLEIIFF